ncbi:hypothetical protein HanXRQr2_Chr13g0575121 [Helianthus annuus]|uniref:Uncharacterized protein n=1 Tax=Helianthus annuus TaxID=4232 RepID=A0A9K3EE83_HELAN|nr:hypothetical protein HanXRQr2_Chr13g0575121 [Helianthus annuus]KAJ0848135.1 hypothetical protein HanPSC8_Chr13g0553621 [Helianthus annuus]
MYVHSSLNVHKLVVPLAFNKYNQCVTGLIKEGDKKVNEKKKGKKKKHNSLWSYVKLYI